MQFAMPIGIQIWIFCGWQWDGVVIRKLIFQIFHGYIRIKPHIMRRHRGGESGGYARTHDIAEIIINIDPIVSDQIRFDGIVIINRAAGAITANQV